MSKKIIDRRNASANVPENSRAKIANAPQNRKRSVAKGIVLAIVIIVAILALALVVVNFLIKNIADNISPNGSYKDINPSIAESFKEGNPLYDGTVAENEGYYNVAYEASKNHSVTVNKIRDEKNILNYAFVGIENLDPNSPNAAMIVIASVNKDTNKITYVLVDPASFVQIPYANVVGPLKDAYNLGGSNLVARTITQNFGIDIDGYVEMKMDGAAEMIDILGGIELAMTAEEVEKLNLAIQQYNERFDAEVLEITKKGEKVTLNGVQTLAYLRGTDYNNETAVFNVFAEATRLVASNDLGGMMDLADKLAENAISSIESGDFSAILEIALASKDQTDNVATLNLGASFKSEIWYYEERYITYTDYSAVVNEIQSAIYSK